jgi:hypothetical protein
MRLLRWVFVAMVAASPLAFATRASANHTQGTGINCNNFASQAEAQAYLRAHPYDPEGLDGAAGPNNDDGVACESRPAPYDRTPVVYDTQATTAPTTPPATGCHPDYSGACVPIASDVDCAGGTGDGPGYAQGPFTSTGTDPYGLDRDKDGTACETSGQDLETALISNTTDCAGFPSQAAAQANLRATPSDPGNIDSDNDGIACEAAVYPAGSARDTTVVLAARATRATTRRGAGTVPVTGDFSARLFALGVGVLLAGAYLLWLNRDQGRLWPVQQPRWPTDW